jgi:hypothetical protein
MRRACRSQFSSLLLKLLHLFHAFFDLFLFLFLLLLLSDFWKLLIVFVGKLQHVLLGDLNFLSPRQSTHQLRVLPSQFTRIDWLSEIVLSTSIIWAVDRLIRLLRWSCLHHLLSDERQFFFSLLRLPLLRSFIGLIFSLETSALFEDVGQWFLRVISVITWIIAFNNLQLYPSFVPQRHLILVSGLSWLEGASGLVESSPIVLWLLAELVDAAWHFWIWIAKFTHWSVLIEVYLTWSYFEIVSVLSCIVKNLTFLFNCWYLLGQRLLKIGRLSKEVRLVIRLLWTSLKSVT